MNRHDEGSRSLDPARRRPGRRRRLVLAVAALTAAPLLAACAGGRTSGTSGTPTLNWYIFNEPSGAFTHAASLCSTASNGQYKIKIQLLPSDADGQRQQMVRRSAAKDSSLDILGLDVTWEAEFSDAGWLAPFSDRARARIENGTLKAPLDTATWKGKLVAAPLNTNTQLLWYRKDLVPTPPRTWDEMILMATDLAHRGEPHYVEVQGAQYEGYTVLFNTLVASAGGTILSPDGTFVTLGPPAVRATDAIRALATSPAADPSWSNQKEDDNRLAFEAGHAPFELNYPFIYPSAQKNAPDIFKNLAWAPYPSLVAGAPSHPTIGGIDLGISAYSRHKEQAEDAILCLRNRANQLYAAIKGGLPPTIESLYTDPALVNGGYPFAGAILTSLQNASIRPKTPAYQSVSLTISSTLSPPSSVGPSKIPTLRSKLKDAIESKGLVP